MVWDDEYGSEREKGKERDERDERDERGLHHPL